MDLKVSLFPFRSAIDFTGGRAAISRIRVPYGYGSAFPNTFKAAISRKLD